MSYFQAITLGLLQGLTEFLPISSSAHLVLIPWFFGWPPSGLAFDVAMHWGTLLGVLIYYRRDIADLIKGFFGSFRGERRLQNRLPWYIVFATIPAGIIGLTFEEMAETVFRSPWVMAVTLSGVGLLLYFADQSRKEKKDIDSMTWKQAVLIGTAQGLAIVPGTSRSGITISVALLLAFQRSAAVRFSFLLSIPIILAAGLLKIDFFIQNATNPIFLTGLTASAISGYSAIAFLVAFVKKRSFTPFVIYRILLAGVIVSKILMG